MADSDTIADDPDVLDSSDLFPVEDTSVDILGKCLSSNQELQTRLREYRRKIETELLDIVGTDDLTDDGEVKTEPQEGPSLNPSHVNSLMPFLTPYFRDVKGFSAPDNMDSAVKKERGEVQQAYLLPCKKWSKTEEDELRKIVTGDNVRRLTESLTNEKAKLYNEFRNTEQFPVEEWTNEQLANNLKDIQDKIADITDTIRSFVAEDNVPSREESEHLDWLRISAQMTSDRDDMACKVHWMNMIHPCINHDPWIEEEDEQLIDLAIELQFDWVAIAEQFSTPSKIRLPWQCMEQYQSKLNPEMKLSGPLTKSEATFLDNVIEMCRIGDYIPWHQVKYFIEGRTVFQLKHYWMKKNQLKRGHSWSKLEDEVLVAAVMRHGKDDWTSVAYHVYGRTNRQCRERYMLRLNVLDRKFGNWTQEEDKKLIELARKHDYKWAELERVWKDRNAKQLSHRYELLNNWLASNNKLFSQSSNSSVVRYTRNLTSNNRDCKEIEEHLTKIHGQLVGDKLDEFLKDARLKLMAINDKKKKAANVDRSRRKKSTEEEDIDEQLAEIFSYNTLFANVQTQPLTRGHLDQVVRNEVKVALNNVLSGKDIETTHPLSEVIKMAFDQNVTQQSTQPTSGLKPYSILPPNRAIVRGIHNLISLESFLSKRAADIDDGQSSIEQEKETDSYQMLMRRFLSTFLWPSIISTTDPPSEPIAEGEPHVKKNIKQIREQRSLHATGIAKSRDEQALLINSATGDTKLDEMLKSYGAAATVDPMMAVKEKVQKAESVKKFLNNLASNGVAPPPKQPPPPRKPAPPKQPAEVVERKSTRLAKKRVRAD